jgi:hypothetical protein
MIAIPHVPQKVIQAYLTHEMHVKDSIAQDGMVSVEILSAGVIYWRCVKALWVLPEWTIGDCSKKIEPSTAVRETVRSPWVQIPYTHIACTLIGRVYMLRKPCVGGSTPPGFTGPLAQW